MHVWLFADQIRWIFFDACVMFFGRLVKMHLTSCSDLLLQVTWVQEVTCMLSSRSSFVLEGKFAIYCPLGCTFDKKDAGVSRYPRPSHQAVVHDVTSDIFPHLSSCQSLSETSCSISDFRVSGYSLCQRESSLRIL